MLSFLTSSSLLFLDGSVGDKQLREIKNTFVMAKKALHAWLYFLYFTKLPQPISISSEA
jgi:hypothetical protein